MLQKNEPLRNPLLKHLLDGEVETLVSLTYNTLNETHKNLLLKHLLDGEEETLVSLAYNTLNETHCNPLLKSFSLKLKWNKIEW